MDENRRIKLKPLLIIAVIAIVFAVCCAIFILYLMPAIISKPAKYFTDGPVVENGKDTIRIYDYDGNGKGGTAFYAITNDGIMSIEKSGSWRTLRPNIPGRCTFIAEDYFADETTGFRIYDVTVDENLYVSYDKRDAYKFSCDGMNAFRNGTMTVQSDSGDMTLSEKTADIIRSKVDELYGVDDLVGNDHDVSDCKKLVCKLTVNNEEKFCELYISEDRIYYCNIYDGQENWYEFVPNKLCSIDGINELLDPKD